MSLLFMSMILPIENSLVNLTTLLSFHYKISLPLTFHLLKLFRKTFGTTSLKVLVKLYHH
jgi:hypothetical protein